MQAARNALAQQVTPTKLIAVTVLTSMNESQWQALGHQDSIGK